VENEPEEVPAMKKTSATKQVASSGNQKLARSSANKLTTSSANNNKPKPADYSAKDLLVLAQAYILTSENAIEGTSQKRNMFWDNVAEAFNVLKAYQEDYNNHLQKKKKYNAILAER
jgi:hypothetical protein